MTKHAMLIFLALSLGGCGSLLISGYIDESDTNGDGALSLDEYFNSQKTKAYFKDQVKKSGMSAEKFAKKEFNQMDTNNDNLVNKQELVNFLDKEL